MNALDNLPLLTLSTLKGQESPISRYEVMSIVNEVARQIDRPYSPGAVYHCIKQLSDKKMIDFNQDLVELSPAGDSALAAALTLAPAPSSLAKILCRILSLQLVRNPDLKREGYRRLSIEMIKNNQTNREDSQFLSDHKLATNICQRELSLALTKIILELSA
jgi:hypothetical protein